MFPSFWSSSMWASAPIHSWSICRRPAVTLPAADMSGSGQLVLMTWGWMAGNGHGIPLWCSHFVFDHQKSTGTKQKGDDKKIMWHYGGTLVVESTIYEILFGGGGFEWGQAGGPWKWVAWWFSRFVLRNPDRLEKDRKELFPGDLPIIYDANLMVNTPLNEEGQLGGKVPEIYSSQVPIQNSAEKRARTSLWESVFYVTVHHHVPIMNVCVCIMVDERHFMSCVAQFHPKELSTGMNVRVSWWMYVCVLSKGLGDIASIYVNPVMLPPASIKAYEWFGIHPKLSLYIYWY